MIGLQHYLTLSAMLFVLSIAGIIVNRRNLILLLMCIELMLLAVNFNFIAFSRHLGDETGQVQHVEGDEGEGHQWRPGLRQIVQDCL